MDDNKAVEYSWAAGFFDGEGCFTTGGHNGSQLKLRICQNDKEVLIKFMRIMGVGSIKGPYSRGKRSPYYEYTVSAYKSVVHVFECMFPYLGSVKREQYYEKWYEYQRNPIKRKNVEEV